MNDKDNSNVSLSDAVKSFKAKLGPDNEINPAEYIYSPAQYGIKKKLKMRTNSEQKNLDDNF